MVVGELAHERDVVVIGAGPGGYHAAIRAAQLGLSVVLVEKEEVGGICLNKGCIPSKVFAHASQSLNQLAHMNDMGIEWTEVAFRLAKLQQYKTKVISQLRQGIEALCKANKIDIVKGKASFLAEDRIGVERGDAFDVYRFRYAVIATGASLETPEISDDRVFHAYSIYELNEIPEHLLVYGSDYIALEAATSFRALGANVTIILERESFPLDPSINREWERLLKKMKIKVYKQCRLENIQPKAHAVCATFTTKAERFTIEGSHFFFSYLWKANIEGLGIERLNLHRTDEGFLAVNRQAQTSIPHIFAVGDVTGGPMSAVKAIKQGKVAAETMAGKAAEVDWTFLPTVVYSTPPIAFVGLTEEEAKQQYGEIRVGQFPLAGNGYASIVGQKEGLVKVISDAKTDVVLGVHLIGAGAVELISSGAIGLEMAGREEDFTFPLYPHPSVNESLLEAMEALTGKAVHLPPTKTKEAVSR
ncbi:dihydrolipoyl dehydrogenase [Anoxybacteroides amylolyticum]|uniref:Dihydrolipoyl dehydrogenase n=1 Tax=Anoxybacteroides amylolyticum TaxID=294699 RepID=A0A160F4X4_9BACL|nr:dihydrolipoyl dehydrogenase [Anoxybacillus amylolyticus]ANB61519.1 dihydrolipoyl dehydrogenase [Anoxybacillus amylolyticus]